MCGLRAHQQALRAVCQRERCQGARGERVPQHVQDQAPLDALHAERFLPPARGALRHTRIERQQRSKIRLSLSELLLNLRVKGLPHPSTRVCVPGWTLTPC